MITTNRGRSPKRFLAWVGIIATLAIPSTILAARAPNPVLRDTTYLLLATEGDADTVFVREFEFAHPVIGADADSLTQSLIVGLDAQTRDVRGITWLERGARRLLAYDLSARKITWESSGEGVPMATRSGHALLWEDDGGEIVSLHDGARVAALPGRSFARSDGTILSVTDDRVQRLDLATGEVVWSVRRRVRGIVGDIAWRDTVACLIADGLQCVELRGGASWSYASLTRRSDLYAAPGGGTVKVRSLYGGARAERLAARPISAGADVYFAADTSVVCLDAIRGDVRWLRHLPRQRGFSIRSRALGAPATPQFLGALLLRETGAVLAVASQGWASGPDSDWLADPPTLALLAKADGRVLARVQVPDARTLNDLWSDERGHFVVLPDRVLLLDDSLRVNAELAAPVESQPLGGLIHAGDALVVTCRGGLLAFGDSPLRVLWTRRCGRLLALENGFDEFGSRWALTTQGLQRLDEGAGRRPSTSFPFRSTWASFREGGVVAGAGTILRLVTLPEPRPVPHLD
jgi:outer membrane protein assembly factor BamB